MPTPPPFKRKLLRVYRTLETSFLPYFTETYHKWEEYAYFIILTQTTHFCLAWIKNKPFLNYYNDLYYLFAFSTCSFFLSYPLIEEGGRAKRLPLHTDSIIYLVFYTAPVILLSLSWDMWDHYVFRSSEIRQWGGFLWALFFLNLSIFIPFVLKNLFLAHRHGELWVHLGGYCSVILFLVPGGVALKSAVLHIHHWFFSAVFLSFSRFAERPSRIFHAICLGIHVQGIAVYGADTIFQKTAPV